MFQKVHRMQVNVLKKTEVVREVSRSLNRQVVLLRLSAVSHCWFPVAYNSAKFSFHLWGLTWVFGLKFGQNSWVVPKKGDIPTVLFKHWNSLLSASILWSRTWTWHLKEWWPLCQGNTFRKICLNPRSRMLSSCSSLLSKKTSFILELSRGFSVIAECVGLEPGPLPGLRAGRLWWDVSAACWQTGTAGKLPGSTGKTTAKRSVHQRENTERSSRK